MTVRAKSFRHAGMSFQPRNYELTDAYIITVGSKRFFVGSPSWMVDAKTSVEESPVAVQGTAPLSRCESSSYMFFANLASVQNSVVDNKEFVSQATLTSAGMTTGVFVYASFSRCWPQFFLDVVFFHETSACAV